MKKRRISRYRWQLQDLCNFVLMASPLEFRPADNEAEPTTADHVNFILQHSLNEPAVRASMLAEPDRKPSAAETMPDPITVNHLNTALHVWATRDGVFEAMGVDKGNPLEVHNAMVRAQFPNRNPSSDTPQVSLEDLIPDSPARARKKARDGRRTAAKESAAPEQQ
jgi:hypothetical protein